MTSYVALHFMKSGTLFSSWKCGYDLYELLMIKAPALEICDGMNYTESMSLLEIIIKYPT